MLSSLLLLKKYGFGNNFIDWIKVLQKSKESCIINGGHTAKYFKLERGARQGDPISTYLFILALQIFFIIIKTNKNIYGLKTFDHEYLYTAYVDDTTFFLEDISSIKVVLKDFKIQMLILSDNPLTNLTGKEPLQLNM